MTDTWEIGVTQARPSLQQDFHTFTGSYQNARRYCRALHALSGNTRSVLIRTPEGCYNWWWIINGVETDRNQRGENGRLVAIPEY